jgi:hypothetical protein
MEKLRFGIEMIIRSSNNRRRTAAPRLDIPAARSRLHKGRAIETQKTLIDLRAPAAIRIGDVNLASSFMAYGQTEFTRLSLDFGNVRRSTEQARHLFNRGPVFEQPFQVANVENGSCCAVVEIFRVGRLLLIKRPTPATARRRRPQQRITAATGQSPRQRFGVVYDAPTG